VQNCTCFLVDLNGGLIALETDNFTDELIITDSTLDSRGSFSKIVKKETSMRAEPIKGATRGIYGRG
jgi:hypothetical protein